MRNSVNSIVSQIQKNNNKALLLIDLQNDFCHGGSLAVTDGDETIEVANALMPLFKGRVFASKDYHPYDHKSFAATHVGKKVGDIIDLNGISQFLWPRHCVAGESGSSYHPKLNSHLIDHEILKGQNKEIDSYSAFFENDRKTKTSLDQLLRSQGIDTLFVMGLATDYCVKYTVLDALSLGYKVYVIERGCRAVNISPNDGVLALKEMEEAGANISIVNSLLDVDFYKFTMAQVFFNEDLRRSHSHEARYMFKNRGEQNLAPYIDEIKNQIICLHALSLHPKEINHLVASAPLQAFSESYLLALKNISLDVSDVDVFINEKNELAIEVYGQVLKTTWYETMILSIVNEVYRKNTYGSDFSKAKDLLYKKMDDFKSKGEIINLVDFSTRRRASYQWQKEVCQILKNEGRKYGINFLGTSNALVASSLNLSVFGTMAHEYFQFFQPRSPNHSQSLALQEWVKTYGKNLASCLTDIFGVKAFLNDIDASLLNAFTGFRHDSGDPIEWAHLMIRRFKLEGIDPTTKTLIFSDGLNFSKAAEIVKSLKHTGVGLLFGIGTSLSNDLEEGYKSLSIVCKMVSLDGEPVIKISDSSGKEMGVDQVYEKMIRHMIAVKNKNYDLYQGVSRFNEPMTSIIDEIVSFIKKEALSAQSSSLVVGISGGIDSAVVAALCAKTGIPVHGVMLPCHSTPSHVLRAKEVIERFGLQKHEINLEASLSSIASQVDTSSITTKDKERACYGALRSCLRSPALDFIGKIFNGIIVGTGNKDEDGLVRYFQKRGDGCIDISPIADLHKREVYEIAKELGVPDSILQATPSADLWGGEEQSDEAELGLSYAKVEYVSRIAYALDVHIFDLDKIESSILNGIMNHHLKIIKNVAHKEKISRHKYNPNISVASLEKFDNDRKNYRSN